MTNTDCSDEISFLDAMQDVKPLRKNDPVVSLKPQHTLAQQLKRQALEREHSLPNNNLSVECVEPVDPLDQLSFKKSGVQHGVFKNLRLGKYKIDGVLDLHKLKFTQARQLLFEKMLQAQQDGQRTLLIKHGIGLHSKPFPAMLKSYVNQWLKELPQVLAFHSAQQQHGGAASVYVMLKKSEQDKLQNRELQRKR
ncbi:DNA endonuclease SmrA [Aliiglaciecola sp. LCG003]|uniref:DNA endonuclease SmrA n=1 Tax=Aliiglaciecola sp. LCG003 TaxID=3053655 RepID=UPI0025735450|nr:DNA endonuclease SmrA [Aliiglaciecola sp. LCG003]WJG10532.1 DNA endonuclease SmrA [Aliiglaciecola sp. LCG003]